MRADRRPEKEKASWPRRGRVKGEEGEGGDEGGMGCEVGVVGRLAQAERAAPGDPAPSDQGICGRYHTQWRCQHFIQTFSNTFTRANKA